MNLIRFSKTCMVLSRLFAPSLHMYVLRATSTAKGTRLGVDLIDDDSSFHAQLMHRALLISEVLSEIFAHVNEDLGPRLAGKKPSLEALARTCKAFHEPAMDLLWADLDGITPLLGCVPRLHRLIYPSGSKVSPD